MLCQKGNPENLNQYLNLSGLPLQNWSLILLRYISAGSEIWTHTTGET